MTGVRSWHFERTREHCQRRCCIQADDKHSSPDGLSGNLSLFSWRRSVVDQTGMKIGDGMRQRRTQHWITWLAMAVLVAQTWFAPLALSAAAGQADGLVICTGTGFKVIPLPDGRFRSPDQDDRSDDMSAEFDCT